MASREWDWLTQAEHDLNVARTTRAARQFDWACFASQQAAEKALKALYQHHHSEGWGHQLVRLVEELAQDEPAITAFVDSAKELDKFYIPTRYPNGLVAGAPAEVYTDAEAGRAIDHAETIIRFCSLRCRA